MSNAQGKGGEAYRSQSETDEQCKSSEGEFHFDKQSKSQWNVRLVGLLILSEVGIEEEERCMKT